MPHHSKQQRLPVGGSSFPPHSSPGGGNGSHYYRRGIMPPPGISASMSMPPGNRTTVLGAPPPPLHHSALGLQQHPNSWMSHQSHGPLSSYQQHTIQQQQGIYRVPITPLKGDDSSKDGNRLLQTNSVSSSSREASPPMMLKQHSRSKSFESQHEIAASVLLLASSIRDEERNRANLRSKSNEEDEESDDNLGNGDDSTSDNKRPLKKRKKVTDIIAMRTKIHHDEDHPFHVSPMSGPSSGHTSPSMPSGSEDPITTTPSSSYDVRDIESTNNIEILSTHTGMIEEQRPGDNNNNNHRASPLVQDFPVTMHSVLSDAEFADNVVKWLPDGKSWKIVRWDALRRQILPKYFPSLQSIDAFLSHLQVWGFTEINDGPDAGAYSHMFFRRGHPDLCSEMIARRPSSNKFENSSNPELKSVVVLKDPSDQYQIRDHSRSILRVPSLASTSSSIETHRAGNHGGSDQLTRFGTSVSNGFGKIDYSSVNGPVSSSYTREGWQLNGGVNSRLGASHPVFVNYRPDEMAVLDQHQQHKQLQWNYQQLANSSSSRPINWSRGDLLSGSGLPQQAQHPSTTSPSASPVVIRGMPPYSPIRIRSSRGRHRPSVVPVIPRGSQQDGAISSSFSTSSSSVQPPLPSRTFPVSNRGMGRRPIPLPPVLSRSYEKVPGAEELHMLKMMKAENEGVDINDAGTSAKVSDTDNVVPSSENPLPSTDRTEPEEEKKEDEAMEPTEGTVRDEVPEEVTKVDEV